MSQEVNGLNQNGQDKVRIGATVIFTFSSLFVCVLGFLGVYKMGGGVSEDYFYLRVMDLNLKVLGSAVIVIIVLAMDSIFARIFGLLVVAGLVIGTADIVRLVLVATDSDRKFEDFFANEDRPETGSQIEVDANGLTNAIIRIIEQNRGDESALERQSFRRVITEKEVNARRADLRRAIAREINIETNTRLMRQVQSANAVFTLSEFGDNKVENWVYRYGKDQRFVTQARYLRRQGLIRYPFDDFDSIEITDLGCQILFIYDKNQDHANCVLSAESAIVPATSNITLGTAGGESDVRGEFSRRNPNKLGSVSLTSSLNKTIKVSGREKFFEFSVSEPGLFEIYVPEDESDLESDPKIRLFHADQSVSESSYITDSGFVVDSDDAEGFGFSSRLLVNLRPEEKYLLSIQNIGEEEVEFPLYIGPEDAARKERVVSLNAERERANAEVLRGIDTENLQSGSYPWLKLFDTDFPAVNSLDIELIEFQEGGESNVSFNKALTGGRWQPFRIATGTPAGSEIEVTAEISESRRNFGFPMRPVGTRSENHLVLTKVASGVTGKVSASDISKSGAEIRLGELALTVEIESGYDFTVWVYCQSGCFADLEFRKRNSP